jgi:hypothetical protein
MRIKLNRAMAGPDGCFSADEIVDMPAPKAQELVRRGFAIAIDRPPGAEAVPGEAVAANRRPVATRGASERRSA